MSEEFVDFAEGDRREVLALLRNQPFKEMLWEWQYLQNPAAAHGSALILLKIDGKLAGFNGTMPVKLRLDGHTTEAIWSCDTFIDEAWRGKGLGQKLFAAVERKSPLVLGYGISDMAYPLLIQKRGWCPIETVEEFFFQRSIRSLSDILKVAQQWRWLSAAPSQSNSWTVDHLPADQMPADVNSLWAAVESGYDRAVVRDYAYLYWKYGQHPTKAYTVITLRRDGELHAVGVVRATSREARLVDYVGPRHDRVLKRSLLRAFAASAGNAARLNVSTSDSELKESLLDLGYRLYRTKERFALWSQKPIEKPTDGWFIMRGDSDGDLLDACKE